MRRTKFLAPILLVLILAGCVPRPAAVVPTPPAVQAASVTKALAATLDTTVPILVAARDQNRISAAELESAFKIMETMGGALKRINAVLVAPGTWDQQRLQILTIVSAAGLPYLAAQLPPNARAVIQQVITEWDQVALAAGGPTI